MKGNSVGTSACPVVFSANRVADFARQVSAESLDHRHDAASDCFGQ